MNNKDEYEELRKKWEIQSPFAKIPEQYDFVDNNIENNNPVNNNSQFINNDVQSPNIQDFETSQQFEIKNDKQYDADDLANKFRSTISLINIIFDNGLRQTEFRRVHILYTLFTSLYRLPC